MRKLPVLFSLLLWLSAASVRPAPPCPRLLICPAPTAQWRADCHDVQHVLYSAAEQLWRYFPKDKALPPIIVAPKGGPVVWHKRGLNGEYFVQLNTGETYWAQYAFQFAHEFCHILCGYTKKEKANRWFEESLCEVASLFALRHMAEAWAKNPPYPNWRSFGPHLASYAEKRQKGHRLPPDETLAQWYRRNEAVLRKNPTDRERNLVVATALLELFEAKPSNWPAVESLNVAAGGPPRSFARYLREWYNNAAEIYRPFIASIASRFGLSVTRSRPNPQAERRLKAAGKTARPKLPDRFAVIFNMGYGGDALPKEPASFERLIRAMKHAHFNTILCKYEKWRAAICRKHNIAMFVDLLCPQHHVYKNVAACEKLCRSLRGSEGIYAYHLWSDNLGNAYHGRSRDARAVRRWDPTHPVYVGCYAMSRIGRVEGMDLFGYYDFHWKRGGHFSHLLKAWNLAQQRGCYFLRYVDPAPGRARGRNTERVGYTIATSIPFGLKGYVFHYTGGVVDTATGKLDSLGRQLREVNAAFAPLGSELLALGNPKAVYSTEVGRNAENEPIKGGAALPGGLSRIPADNWFHITRGEVIVGVFRDSKGRWVLALAGHNASGGQEVTIHFKEKPSSLARYRPAQMAWMPLRLPGHDALLQVEKSSVELIRIAR